MHRQTNRPAIVGDGAPDRLADPPGRVGRELEAASELKAIDRFHQADVAFLDQIEQREPASEVALGDRDHQAEIGFDQLLLRLDEQVLALLHLFKPLTELPA